MFHLCKETLRGARRAQRFWRPNSAKGPGNFLWTCSPSAGPPQDLRGGRLSALDRRGTIPADSRGPDARGWGEALATKICTSEMFHLCKETNTAGRPQGAAILKTQFSDLDIYWT